VSFVVLTKTSLFVSGSVNSVLFVNFLVFVLSLLSPVQSIAWVDSSRNDVLCDEWDVRIRLFTPLTD